MKEYMVFSLWDVSLQPPDLHVLCEKSRAKLEWCAAIFPIAGEFTKLSEQSRSGHLKQIFSSQITRIGDGDWSDWLAIPNVRTKPLGRRIHPHSTGDLYRLKNLFASLEIVQNFTWKRKSLQHVSPCHHFFWGIPKIIPMWWACRMSYSICSRACRGSLRWFCGWLPSLKCLAVCSPCPCPCPQIPNHGSWNIMKWWISVDIQKKHVWYQIPLYMKSIEIT